MDFDLYESVDDIVAHGQTIVYAIHELIGHLGIFVSGSVAKKEHDEFASNIDLIDVLPPGLYEAVLTTKDPSDRAANLISGTISFASKRATSMIFESWAANFRSSSSLLPPSFRISSRSRASKRTR